MRKATILLASVVVATLLASGVALAAQINCPSGGKLCVGTFSPDDMNGTEGRNTMFGRSGGDTLNGFGEADTMRGEYGNDVIVGGAGGDSISGGDGGDRIYGQDGVDTIDGNSGNDIIRAADGQPDSISCGTGNDTAAVDDADLRQQNFEDFVRLTSCENVIVR